MSKKSKTNQHLPAQHSPQSPPSHTIQKHSVAVQQYSGPLPPPEALAQYNEVLPGAAERIMAMAERQSSHRQGLENIAVSAQTRDSLIGLIFGLVIGLATICGGVICIMNGHEIGGTILGGTGLASLVGVFVYGSQQRRSEREAKWKKA
jgi:uncharacterized membrane protein